jgi:hypothetical protein
MNRNIADKPWRASSYKVLFVHLPWYSWGYRYRSLFFAATSVVPLLYIGNGGLIATGLQLLP